MDVSQFSVDIHVPLHCYNTIASTGNASFPNIYNKTEIDNIINNSPSDGGGSGGDNHRTRTAVLEFSDVNILVLTLFQL